jgi:hypothetical protein
VIEEVCRVCSSDIRYRRGDGVACAGRGRDDGLPGTILEISSLCLPDCEIGMRGQVAVPVRNRNGGVTT